MRARIVKVMNEAIAADCTPADVKELFAEWINNMLDAGTGVDRRTSGGVSNHFAVTEQLRNQLHVRSFTTTGRED